MKATKAAAPPGFVAGLRAAAALLTVLITVLLAGCWFEIIGIGQTAEATLTVAMKQPAGTITSVALVVTGPGMAPITREVPMADTALTVDVPAGPDRTFRILINTVSVTFMGEATVDLAAGEAAAVSLYPELHATQIIVPDATNGRVVQIADMSGAGWVEVYEEDFGYFGGDFAPYDVDFDAQGRIYIASNPGGTEGTVVFRLDDINARTYEEIAGASETEWVGVTAIAVDRTRGYLYYTTGTDNSIYRKTLDPLGGADRIDIGGIEALSTTGLAVGPAGYVYLTIDSAGWPGNTLVKIKIDGTSGSQVASYGFPEVPVVPLNDPWDVIIKSPFVYVSNISGEGPSIVQLTEDLVFVDSYGTPWGGEGDSPPGVFHGPKRFLAPLNAGFFLADEHYSSTDRIVFFSDMSGSEWKTYGSQGPGRDQFSLFIGIF